MADSIARARRELEVAEEALRHAESCGAPADVIGDLAEDAAGAEAAYCDACSAWMPDVSGVTGAGGLVYSDADPGL